ncbi:MAG: Inositol 2-dehydrogenase [Chlamydiae bacterium]|nr:Inositol 2-dehydrogenase [Chlamydiota bacterium]
MIKACLIGAGRMGTDHAKHIHRSADGELYCVVDLNREAADTLAEQYGAKAYGKIEEAFDDSKIEAVVIVSNTATHADLISAFAKLKKPIFCEKPIDLTLEKTDECLAAVEEYGVPLLIGFNRRFDPSFQHLESQLRSQLIGNIEQITISSRDLDLPSVDYLQTSGGIFRDMTIHDFDMIRWMLRDEPVEVYATGSCLVDPSLKEFGDVDTAMIVMKTAKGTLCHIFNSRRCVFGYDQRIEVSGARGTLHAHNLHETTVVHSNQDGVKQGCPYPSFPQRYKDAYQLEMDHFFTDVVRKGEKPWITGKDGRQAMVIANAATESLETGKLVTIPEPQVIDSTKV